MHFLKEYAILLNLMDVTKTAHVFQIYKSNLWLNLNRYCNKRSAFKLKYIFYLKNRHSSGQQKIRIDLHEELNFFY